MDWDEIVFGLVVWAFGIGLALYIVISLVRAALA